MAKIGFILNQSTFSCQSPEGSIPNTIMNLRLTFNVDLKSMTESFQNSTEAIFKQAGYIPSSCQIGSRISRDLFFGSVSVSS